MQHGRRHGAAELRGAPAGFPCGTVRMVDLPV